MDTITHADAPPRIATETIEHDIDGVNTVIAQEGQPVPRAFAHLVPDEVTVAGEQEYIESRSTTARRAAHAAKAADEDTKPARGRRAAKAADEPADKDAE